MVLKVVNDNVNNTFICIRFYYFRSVVAWRILGMGKSGGLPSMGSNRVGHY